jgi:hypothetical protein
MGGVNRMGPVEADRETDDAEFRIASPAVKETKEAMRRDFLDYLERLEKGNHYLLVAHGAGFAGCLAVLKDYSAVPQLKGLGVFVWLFGYGFLAAALSFIFLISVRSEAVDTFAHYMKLKTRPTQKAHVAAISIMGISMFLLAAAIWLICNKLASL